MSGVPSTLSVSCSSQATTSGGVANRKSLEPCSSMVGTSARSGQRSSPVTARQRQEPALMCGAAGGSEPELSCTVPASSAAKASPPPLNTTSSSCGRSSLSLSTSSWICAAVPIGGVAQLYLAGSARASATKSFMLFAGSSERTTKVLGEVASSLIGTKSL